MNGNQKLLRQKSIIYFACWYTCMMVNQSNAFACMRYCASHCAKHKRVHVMFLSIRFPWNGLVCSLFFFSFFCLSRAVQKVRHSIHVLIIYCLWLHSLFLIGYFPFYFFSIFLFTLLEQRSIFTFCLLLFLHKSQAIVTSLSFFPYLFEILVISQVMFVTALKSIILSFLTRLSKMALSFRSWINHGAT